MLALSGKLIAHQNFDASGSRIIVRVTTHENRPHPLRANEAFFAKNDNLPSGFGVYLALASNATVLSTLPRGVRSFVLPDDFAYLTDGDVLRIWPLRRALRTLYRRNANYNSFLVTERCNHYCLMCSQPPKDIDDRWIVDDIVSTLKLIDPSTREIGLTGGEPTLLGDDFLRILRVAKNYLPRTALHVLSNGRRFADTEFVKAYTKIGHPDLMVGIPIYSDLSTVHNYIVQADGAFDETVRGILNLKMHRQRVEVRTVIHRQSYERLPHLAEFIARNLTFVDQVALMGLEITGFAKANLSELWIDPFDYRKELFEAATILAGHQLKVAIYNHQLCLLDQKLWQFARKSISDWKNEYIQECALCSQRESCGGFFSSSMLKHSDHIRPLS